jgi:hypothetical protein
MFVQVVLSGTSSGNIVAKVDSGSSPSSEEWDVPTITTTGSAFFVVPVGYHYEVTAGSGTVAYWNEYTTSFGVTRSANLSGTLARLNEGSVSAQVIGTTNARMVTAIGSSSGGGSVYFWNGDSPTTPQWPGWAVSSSANNTDIGFASTVGSDYTGANFYSLYHDGGGDTVGNLYWFEFSFN